MQNAKTNIGICFSQLFSHSLQDLIKLVPGLKWDYNDDSLLFVGLIVTTSKLTFSAVIWPKKNWNTCSLALTCFCSLTEGTLVYKILPMNFVYSTIKKVHWFYQLSFDNLHWCLTSTLKYFLTLPEAKKGKIFAVLYWELRIL